ncbi:MAG TPA: ABC transporter permease [Gemmatimonadaceae bacterium]|jgi:predicted permease|nr:ABC transporter permease [Gemmatimonadaceae bacterium]
MPGPLQQLATLWRRARFYAHRERFERDLAEEMRFHIDMKAQSHRATGMAADEAHWAARRQFGNASRLREETGDVMAVGWVDAAIQDARYAVRSLRKTPAFTAVAVASLALGIGATTAVFTLGNVMLLRPLPFPDAERLVLTFQTITPGVFAAADSMPWSYERYLRLRAMVPAFADAGFSTWEEYNLRRTGAAASKTLQPAERVRAELVTTSLFPTLGARAMLGRVIGPVDSMPTVSGGAVAVLSEPLWRRLFGGDSAVLGTTVVLDQLPVTIVGVMPASFPGIRENAEMWLPVTAVSELARARGRQQFEGGSGTVIARLKPQASLAAANAQVLAASAEINKLLPPPRFGPREAVWSGGVIGFAEARRHPLIRPLLVVLSVAVAGVLLIVCANVAGLLLARARARESELGVRIALGAGRGRLARQMLTESLVLAVLGGVPGVLVAYFGATTLARLRPTLPLNFALLRSVDLLEGVSLAPDWRVLTFISLLTVVVGLAFGTVPALAASRTSIAELVKAAANRGGTTRARGRRALVVGQVALATILLVAAGLMVRSFRGLLRSDFGFNADDVVMMRLAGGDQSEAALLRRREMLTRIAALPGVEAAATHNCAPFTGDCSLAPVVSIDGRRVERSEFPPIELHSATSDYLSVLRIRLRGGRWFDEREEAGPSATALVNETAARLLWPGQSPVGRRFSYGGSDAPPVEVIGVVADVKYDGLDAPTRPALYRAGDAGGSVLFVRTRGGDPAAAVPAIRRLAAASDPTIAIHGVMTGDALIARAASTTRFVTTLLVSFGVGAALLAALGVYGVLAYLVAQRKREFGVRMAIGAHPGSVLALVVKQGAVLTAIGLVAGVAGAIAATRLLRGFLFGVAPADVPTYVAIVVLVGTAGVLAALVPALRATRVDPVIALRD